MMWLWVLAEKEKIRDSVLSYAYRSVTHQWTKQAASKKELVSCFRFVLDFLGDLSFMCMCVSLCEFVFIPYVQEPMEVERLSDPLSLDCHTQLWAIGCGCWESDSGRLQDQQALGTAESSLQPQKGYFKKKVFKFKSCVSVCWLRSTQWSWRLGALDIVELESSMARTTGHGCWELNSELCSVCWATEPFLQLPFPKSLTLIMRQVLLSQPNYSDMWLLTLP